MTYDPNAAWTARATARHQIPRYFIIMEGVAAFRISTGVILGATTTYKELMRTPRGVTQQVFPLEGKFTIGNITLPLVDKDGDITNLLSDGQVVPTWINRDIELFAGYDDLDESDFAKIFEGEVSDWTERDGTYAVKVKNLMGIFNNEIMTNSTEDVITEITGNPIDIYYAIITGDFANGTFPVVVTGATPTGLDLAASKVDTVNFIKERDDWLFGTVMRFQFRESEKAKDFFEEELFLLFGYPIIRPDGKLGIRLYHPPNPADPTVDLTEDDIIGTPRVKTKFKDHINRVQIFGDFNPDAEDEEFASLLDKTDAADVTATGEEKSFDVESKGFRTILNGVRSARFAGNKILQRYTVPPIEMTVETLFSKRVIEVGEVVFITHKNVFNPNTGARGMTQIPFEVLKAKPNFNRGTITFTLLGTGFNRQYRVIAPNATPDYGSQSQSEKDTFMSIADTGTELLGGVDPAHQII